jgi:hypothetical protein
MRVLQVGCQGRTTRKRAPEPGYKQGTQKALSGTESKKCAEAALPELTEY